MIEVTFFELELAALKFILKQFYKSAKERDYLCYSCFIPKEKKDKTA